MVRSHMILAQALGKLTGDPLGHASGVDENERGAVRLNELGQAIIDLGPDFGRHYGLERRSGTSRRDRAPAMTGIDDRAGGLRGATRLGPHQKRATASMGF